MHGAKPPHNAPYRVRGCSTPHPLCSVTLLPLTAGQAKAACAPRHPPVRRRSSSCRGAAWRSRASSHSSSPGCRNASTGAASPASAAPARRPSSGLSESTRRRRRRSSLSARGALSNPSTSAGREAGGPVEHRAEQGRAPHADGSSKAAAPQHLLPNSAAGGARLSSSCTWPQHAPHLAPARSPPAAGPPACIPARGGAPHPPAPEAAAPAGAPQTGPGARCAGSGPARQ